MTAISPNRWAVLSVVTLVSFITNLDATIVVIGLPSLTEGLHMSINTGIWMLTSFFITSTVFMLPAGRWSDMFGTKRIFLWGFALFTIFTAVCGFANSGVMLILGRLFQGAGAAMALATATPTIMRAFPANQLGLALGINNISWVTGSLVGPVLGGILIGTLGWRSIFFVAVPVGIIGLIGAFFILQDGTASSRVKTDWAGILTFGLGLSALLMALSEGQVLGWTSIETLGLFLVTLVLWIAFVRIELSVEHPLFPLSLLTVRNYSIGLAIVMSYCTGYFAVTVLLTLYLQEAQLLSPFSAGMILIALSIPQLFTAPFGGKLADRFGPAYMILIGTLLIGTSLLFLGQLGSHLSDMNVIIPLLVISAATGLSWPSLAKATLSAAPAERAGSAAGMFWTVYNMSRALSQAIALVIIQMYTQSSTSTIFSVGVMRHGPSKNSLVFATDIGFRLFAVFLAMAFVFGFLLRRPQRHAHNVLKTNQ